MLPLDIFKLINADEYNNLKNYLNSFEKFLQVELNNIDREQENLKNQNNGLLKFENDVIEEYLKQRESFIQRKYYFETIFTSNFRNTFLGLIISALENILKDICFQYKIIKKSSFDLNDLKGNSDIEKAKTYLTKLSNKNIGKIEKWSEINDFKFIRNKMTHQNGKISNKSKEATILRTIVAKYEGISFKEQNNELNIWITSRVFCNKALDDCFDFINNLIDALKEDEL